MDASTINLPSTSRRRGRYSDVFNAEIVATCEAPSGLTYLAFQQDFAAKVLADNLCKLLSAETAPLDAASRPNRTYT